MNTGNNSPSKTQEKISLNNIISDDNFIDLLNNLNKSIKEYYFNTKVNISHSSKSFSLLDYHLSQLFSFTLTILKSNNNIDDNSISEYYTHENQLTMIKDQLQTYIKESQENLQSFIGSAKIIFREMIFQRNNIIDEAFNNLISEQRDNKNKEKKKCGNSEPFRLSHISRNASDSNNIKDNDCSSGVSKNNIKLLINKFNEYANYVGDYPFPEKENMIILQNQILSELNKLLKNSSANSVGRKSIDKKNININSMNNINNINNINNSGLPSSSKSNKNNLNTYKINSNNNSNININNSISTNQNIDYNELLNINNDYQNKIKELNSQLEELHLYCQKIEKLKEDSNNQLEKLKHQTIKDIETIKSLNNTNNLLSKKLSQVQTLSDDKDKELSLIKKNSEYTQKSLQNTIETLRNQIMLIAKTNSENNNLSEDKKRGGIKPNFDKDSDKNSSELPMGGIVGMGAINENDTESKNRIKALEEEILNNKKEYENELKRKNDDNTALSKLLVDKNRDIQCLQNKLKLQLEDLNKFKILVINNEKQLKAKKIKEERMNSKNKKKDNNNNNNNNIEGNNYNSNDNNNNNNNNIEFPPSPSPSTKDISEIQKLTELLNLEKENNNIKIEKITKLEQDISKLKIDKEKLTTEKTLLENERKSLKSENDSLSIKISGYNEHIKSLNQEIKICKEETDRKINDYKIEKEKIILKMKEYKTNDSLNLSQIKMLKEQIKEIERQKNDLENTNHKSMKSKELRHRVNELEIEKNSIITQYNNEIFLNQKLTNELKSKEQQIEGLNDFVSKLMNEKERNSIHSNNQSNYNNKFCSNNNINKFGGGNLLKSKTNDKNNVENVNININEVDMLNIYHSHSGEYRKNESDKKNNVKNYNILDDDKDKERVNNSMFNQKSDKLTYNQISNYNKNIITKNNNKNNNNNNDDNNNNDNNNDNIGGRFSHKEDRKSYDRSKSENSKFKKAKSNK